jgi:hypothetical protein
MRAMLEPCKVYGSVRRRYSRAERGTIQSWHPSPLHLQSTPFVRSFVRSTLAGQNGDGDCMYAVLQIRTLKTSSG